MRPIRPTKRPSGCRPPPFTINSIASKPAVAAALVRDSAELAEPVVKALRASHPRWVPGYTIKVLDGNHLSSTEHRLQELRGTWAAPLPGQALVVLDQQRMLITDVILNEDGHAQERRMIPEVLAPRRGG